MPTVPTANPAPPRWVIAAPKVNLVVGVGDMLTSNDAAAILVTYSLGSCVGVTAYDPVAKVGGLLHAMLPDSTINTDRATARPYMFVDTGLPALFHAIYALGGLKPRLVIKLAGGAELLDEKRVFNIGNRNVDTVLSMLARNSVKLVAQDTGGRQSRTVRLNLSNGNVTLDMPGKPNLTL
jgi:chemotaxis protein CheD